MLKKPLFFRKVSFVMPAAALISASLSPWAHGAEIWSEPTYTEQWSSPTYTEQWSAEPEAEPAAPPSEPIPAGVPEAPSIYIKLMIDSLQATVQNKETALDTPPSVVNGRTMVPFRFLGEALQASVEWDGHTQTITLSQEGTTVILTVNQPAASVNGRIVPLDAPPVISGGRTLVPLRFVAESLDLSVNHTAATNTIEIRSGGGGSAAGAVTQPTPEPSANADNGFEPITDFEQLYGTWQIWTPGGATNLYYKDTGDYATHEYTAGAAQGTVTIRSDGTYSMQYDLWGDAEGEWRLTYPREINGEVVIGIVLESGSGGYDWAVAPSENGKIRLLYSWGAWADGSASWSFDSELYKE